MVRVDILNILKEVGREKGASDGCKFAGLNRLQGHQVKRDVVRQDFADSQWRLVNQHRVSVVSYYTLRVILRGRFEHSWIDGLMCSEEDILTN